jgi:hypothetical protein
MVTDYDYKHMASVANQSYVTYVTNPLPTVTNSNLC